MGLLKGTWTFSRFLTSGTPSEGFNDVIDRGLKKHAFSQFFAAQAEKTVGWTTVENVLDNEFAFANYACGAYLLFSLRMDRKVVPASLLKLRVLEAEKTYLAESGKKRLYRQEQEAVKDRVRMELLQKALPVPSFYEVCWSPSHNRVIFGSHAEQVTDEFQRLLKESFGITLFPFLPWNQEQASKVNIKPVTSEGSSSSTNVPVDDAANRDLFIGREFLTWLWFKSEERNGLIATPDKGESEVIFLHRLVLAAGDGEYSETVVCQGMHADMQEGKEALRRGKKIREARLRVSQDENRWEFTFKADLFQFQSLKLPAVMDMEDEKDWEGRTLERIYLMEKIIATMDSLFAVFTNIRRSPQWEGEELPRMEKWLKERP